MQKCISSCYTLNYTIYKYFTSNIAEKKGNELYNCELYNCSEIQFSLALYNRSVTTQILQVVMAPMFPTNR